MYSNISKFILFWLFLYAGVLAMAQPDVSPVIDAGNIDRLAPVVAIDFDALPPEAGEIRNGRVVVSADGSHIAVVNIAGQVVILDSRGTVLDATEVILTDDDFPATFIDGAFNPAGDIFAALHTTGSGYSVTLHGLQRSAQTRLIKSQDRPTALWVDETRVWLEMIPDAPDRDPYVAYMPLGAAFVEASPVTLPLAPSQDEAAVARIGRLPPPFAVTATAKGMVSRWDLRDGARTATAQVDAVPIYGALTPDGRYLAWRDPASQALHLLDFESGQDRTVVPLNGSYTPFILLTMQADVIIGVNINDEPMVVAWDTQNGERYDAGLYRQCERPPDMAVLSGDGRTLVIGCDQGLEIWRINE